MPMTDEIMQEDLTVEETDNVEEMPSNTEEVESTEGNTNEEASEFDSLAQKFLEQFEIQYDKNPKKFESVDQLKEIAEMGSALPRYKEKVTKYEEQLNSPHYKWVDEFMKNSGFDNGLDFVKAIKIDEEKNSLIEGGMNEELALQKATEYIERTFGNQVDVKSKQIEDFLNWHNSKVEAGTFKESLDTDNIPSEVLEKHEKGMSLKEAYMDYMLDNIKVNTEQETIKKLSKNKETSTGALNQTAPTNNNMTPDQITKILEPMSSSERKAWISKNSELIEKSGIYN